MILTLCRNLAERGNFKHYTFKDDLVSAAVLDCLQACEKFNCVSSTSAFAYLTTCAWRRMAREIGHEAQWHAIPNPSPGTPPALYR
jgi:DNA-directed RNA polymerase specialized sigma subunit